MDEISDWQDERLRPYRNLPDRALRDDDGRFIAEGTETVRMLLQSALAVESVVLKASLAEKLAPDLAARPEVPVYAVEPTLLSQVVGYQVHRGVLACGRRPELQRQAALLQRAQQPGPLRLLLVDAVHDPWNVGGMLRSARGLGLDAVVLGPGCCDPFTRRAIRVSVGHVFHQPLVAVDDLPAFIGELLGREVTCYAGRLSSDSQPVAGLRPSRRWAVVVGNEDRAVQPAVAACCQPIHIPMAPGVDSLNAGVSAALLAHACLLQESHDDTDRWTGS
ncbi:MAG: TrmH family RNA methyltransferase [Planctomycetota bacterium]